MPTTVQTPMIATNAQMVLGAFRNRIINGAMMIDQRNAGASVATPSSGQYIVDRWAAWTNGSGVFSAGQSSTAPTGFIKSFLLTVTTADASVTGTDYYLISQAIEGFNCSDWGFGSSGAKTITLSFWVRASVTGTFGGCVRNSAGNYNYPFQYTISAANTWEQKSVTISGATAGTWLTNNGIGANVWFSIGTGSTYTDAVNVWTTKTGVVSADSSTNLISTLSATFYITGVQLELGSDATAFDYRPFSTELLLCQRYFCKSHAYGTALTGTPGSSASLKYWCAPTGTQGTTNFQYPALMRTAPTVTFYNPATGATGTARSDANTDISVYATGGTEMFVASYIAGDGTFSNAYTNIGATAEL